MKKKYLINTPLGFFITMADSPIEAWYSFTTEKNNIGLDSFLDRSDLIEKGYRAVIPTTESNVFLLIKQSKKITNNMKNKTKKVKKIQYEPTPDKTGKTANQICKDFIDWTKQFC